MKKDMYTPQAGIPAMQLLIDASETEVEREGPSLLRALLRLERVGGGNDGVAEVTVGARVGQEPGHERQRLLLLGVQLDHLLDRFDQVPLAGFMLLDRCWLGV